MDISEPEGQGARDAATVLPFVAAVLLLPPFVLIFAAPVVTRSALRNREAWALLHAGHRKTPIPDDPANPIYQIAMRNEAAWPIVTWFTARKA